jgi:dihydroorotate dehydrogenase (NAD+) catalytic subunit
MPAVEVNVSCPNVHGGCEFGVDAGALREVLDAVREALRRGSDAKRMFVKLSPIVVALPGSGMVDMARAAIEAGADGLCIANTVPAMAIDVESRRARLANVTGGLSGPAVHPIAVKLVHDVYRGVAREAGVPLVGIGGVMRWDDAAEFILAGATAVEMGTALFADPRAPMGVVKGLEKWMARQRVARVADLTGQVAM